MGQSAKIAGTSLVTATLLSTLLACQKQEGAAERAGKKIDKAVENAGQKIDQAVDKAGQKIEQAGERIQEAAKPEKN